MGGEFGGEWIHLYIWMSPFALHLKLTQHCLLTGCIPIKLSHPWTTENNYVALCSVLWGHSSAAKCPTTINRRLQESANCCDREVQNVLGAYIYNTTQREVDQRLSRRWHVLEVQRTYRNCQMNQGVTNYLEKHSHTFLSTTRYTLWRV